MAFRQVARATGHVQVSWPEGLCASPVTEADAPEIGQFLLRAEHPLHPDCGPPTAAGATRYVTRLFDYHRNDPNYRVALFGSTVVRDEHQNRIIGVCLLGGGGRIGTEFGVYDILVDPARRNRGIGTRMLQRALSVLAESGIAVLHLWREDESPARTLYERLGFRPTGRVE